jgi:hypothetical protein
MEFFFVYALQWLKDNMNHVLTIYNLQFMSSNPSELEGGSLTGLPLSIPELVTLTGGTVGGG